MASTKTDQSLLTDGYSLPASSNVTTSMATLTTSYGSLLLISMTNGGTQTTTAPTAQIQVSSAGSSPWYAYGGALTAPLSGSMTWTIPLSIACQYVNVYFTGGNSYATTIYCHIETVTKI